MIKPSIQGVHAVLDMEDEICPRMAHFFHPILSLEVDSGASNCTNCFIRDNFPTSFLREIDM